MPDITQLTILAGLALAIGFVGGMTGLVLGVLRFPLILSTEISASMAAGTNIGVSTLGACTAAVRHLRQNNIHRRMFIIMASTGATGAFLGSLVTSFVSITLLLIAISIIISYEAFSLIRGSRRESVDVIKNNQKNHISLEAVIGFAIGFLGGLVGLVLGSIRLPAMISVLGMEPRVAVGTNLAASSIMGAAGPIGHLLYGQVDLLILAAMGPAAMAGAFTGARYTNRFGARTLKLLIGLVLIPVAIAMFMKAISAVNA
ncbi:MAG TPA: sulfite exporter TauE/SafE family protein [Nitrososphaera sp.]|jgi:hypothetical protein